MLATIVGGLSAGGILDAPKHMPWRCPACQTQIRHSAGEDRPRTGVSYRCHVCRLELVLDADTQRLKVAPMHDDEPDQKIRRST